MKNFFFFHGLGSSTNAFAPLASVLEEDHHVHLHDFAGFGKRSEETIGNSPIASCIYEFLKLTEELDHLVLVMHSMGSAVALPLAELLGDRIDALINIEGNLIGADCGALSREASKRSPEDYEYYRGEIRKKLSTLRSDAGWQKWGEDFEKVRPEVMIAYARDLVRRSDHYGLLETFRSLPVRKLYLYGDQYLGEEISTRLWGLNTWYVQGASHFVMTEKPVETARVIRCLLED